MEQSTERFPFTEVITIIKSKKVESKGRSCGDEL